MYSEAERQAEMAQCVFNNRMNNFDVFVKGECVFAAEKGRKPRRRDLKVRREIAVRRVMKELRWNCVPKSSADSPEGL